MRRGIVLALVVSAIAVMALADSFVRMVHVSFLQTPVEVSPPSPPGATRTWSKALLNFPITEGEQVRTGRGGEVEIELECGSALRLIPESEFTFTRLRRSEQGIAATTVVLDRGTAFLTVRKNDSQDLAIQVAGGQIGGWHGTTRLRIESPRTGTGWAELLGGRAEVAVDGHAYRLKKSAQLVWSTNQAPAEQAAGREDPWEHWSHHRDQLFDHAMAQGRSLAWLGDASVSTPPVSALPAPLNGSPAINSPSVVGFPSMIVPDPVRPPRQSAPVPRCAE